MKPVTPSTMQTPEGQVGSELSLYTSYNGG